MSDFAVMKKALATATEKLHGLEDGGRVIHGGAAFGDVKNDTEIRADRVLGETIRDVILREGNPARVMIEGLGEVRASGKGWWTVDPLDGSLDYKVRTSIWGGLPYTACITVLSDDSESAKFSDIRSAAVADLRAAPKLEMLSACWYPDDGDQMEAGVTSHHEPGGQPLHTSRETKLDLGSQIVIGEMYYPENREMLARMFAGRKGWLRNPGSAAFEMTLVATGQAVAMVCDRQKQHELGMGYLLTKAAGGVAVDFEGRDLGPRKYDFVTQVPVVLAANQAIAEQILELIANSK
ncbi:MAG: inositol monophosphatase family protein [bacterium]